MFKFIADCIKALIQLVVRTVLVTAVVLLTLVLIIVIFA